MNVLFCASEAAPFAASGGLGDVAGSLPRAIRNRKVACRVVMPLYGDMKQEYREKLTYITNFTVPVGWRNQYCGLFELTHNGVKYYFLDNEYYFKRTGLYGFYDDGDGWGNGFTFRSYNAHDMLNAVLRAKAGYEYPDGWQQLVKRAMECDFSWSASAKQYVEMYQQVCQLW